MPENNIQISDEELLQGLAVSPLPDALKEKFRNGLSSMSQEQKVRLVELIKKGYKEEQKFETEKKEKLATLNDEYAQKMEVAEREEKKYTHEQFEQLEKSEDQKEMENLEAEIAQL